MNKKLHDVFIRLIPIYEQAIKECPVDSWKRYLREKDLQAGICWASWEGLDIDIYSEMADIEEGRWYEPPFKSTSHPEAIRCLQLRVDRMKDLCREFEE